jgi:hypothetical protein
MLRILAILLALAVGFDYVMLDGRYTHSARRMAIEMLHGLER